MEASAVLRNPGGPGSIRRDDLIRRPAQEGEGVRLAETSLSSPAYGGAAGACRSAHTGAYSTMGKARVFAQGVYQPDTAARRRSGVKQDTG
jgi:hypothetical protein